MVADAVSSYMESSVTGQGFRMACLNLPTQFLYSFLRIWGAPKAPTAVEAKAVEVHLVEMTKDPLEGVVAEEQG